MEKSLLSCIVASGVVEQLSDNGQVVGFVSDKFPIQFKDSVGETRKNEVVAIFDEMQRLSVDKSKIDLKLIEKVAIITKNKYSELLNTEKKLTDNELVRLFTAGNISNGTISEYCKVTKRFYNSKGNLTDNRLKVFGLRELYKLSEFDDEQIDEFMLMLPQITDGVQYDRKFVLDAIKSYINTGAIELTDNSVVESKKTENSKEKLKKAEKQLEEVREVAKNKDDLLNNVFNAIQAIQFELSNNKKLDSKSFLNIIQSYDFYNVYLQYINGVTWENSENKEKPSDIYDQVNEICDKHENK